MPKTSLKKRFTKEEITTRLQAVENRVRRGASLKEACKKLGFSEQTYHRWKKQYSAAKVDPAKRLKELEKENARLRRVVDEFWELTGSLR